MSDSVNYTDLDYLREIAESGQAAPLLGGRFLSWWGALTTMAYAGHWLIASDMLGLDGSAYGWMWGTYLVLGMGGQFLLASTFPASKPGASSVGNRAERIVWQAAGFALFGYFATLMVKSFVTGSTDMGFAYSFAVVFMVYGVGLITTGALGESQTLTRAGIAALCLVPVAAWFAGTATSWLLASIGAALCVLLPGLVMLKNEPKGVE